MSKIFLITYDNPNSSDATIDQVREWTQKASHGNAYVLHVGKKSSACYYAKDLRCQDKGEFPNDKMTDAFDRLEGLRQHRNCVIVCNSAHKYSIIQMLGDTAYWEINPAKLEPNNDNNRPLSKEDFRYNRFDLMVRKVEADLQSRLAKANKQFERGGNIFEYERNVRESRINRANEKFYKFLYASTVDEANKKFDQFWYALSFDEKEGRKLRLTQANEKFDEVLGALNRNPIGANYATEPPKPEYSFPHQPKEDYAPAIYELALVYFFLKNHKFKINQSFSK